MIIAVMLQNLQHIKLIRDYRFLGQGGIYFRSKRTMGWRRHQTYNTSNALYIFDVSHNQFIMGWL